MSKRISVLISTIFFLSMMAACTDDQGEKEQSRQPNEMENTDEIVEKEPEQKEPLNTENGEEAMTDTRDSTPLFENEAFRIFEPTSDTEIGNGFVVRGEAHVYEATVQYELLDENENVITAGYTTASNAAPEWGEFEFIVNWEKSISSQGTLLIFEENAEDGSKRHAIKIPLTFK
jgi:hypothetical protein